MRDIILLFLFIILGCSQPSRSSNHELVKDLEDTSATSHTANTIIVPDSSNQYIYDFMKMVIQDQKLDLSYGLTLEPEPGCDLSGDDYSFLKTLLIETKKTENYEDTSQFGSMTIYTLEMTKCLTQTDIKSMLYQKTKLLPVFRWDNSRLGFDLKNNKNWYCFSIPLFSTDKKKAVMMIRDLCQGLCGTGWTVLFRKEHNKWISETGGQWVH